MTIAKKLVRVAENTPKVYEAGKNEMWEGIQVGGTRNNYDSAFRNWGAEHLEPKYPLITSTLSSMFLECRNLIELPPIELTASTSTYYNAFNTCRALKEINMDIKPSTASTAMNTAFRSCVSLETINKIVSTDGVTFNNTFQGCSALKNVTFEGVVSNNISFADSPLLTKESILGLFGCLATKSGCTVTLGTTNLAKLTDAEKAIATEKGWSLA